MEFSKRLFTLRAFQFNTTTGNEALVAKEVATFRPIPAEIWSHAVGGKWHIDHHRSSEAAM